MKIKKYTVTVTEKSDRGRLLEIHDSGILTKDMARFLIECVIRKMEKKHPWFEFWNYLFK